MQSKDLVTLWNAPDNTRLTPRQISIRLPLHVAAKISALCEMFPKKTKTEIIADLLATALDDLAEGLSNEPYPDEEQSLPDEILGQRKRYENLANKYLKEIETETDEDQRSEGGRARRSYEHREGAKVALAGKSRKPATRKPRTRAGGSSPK